MSGATVPFQVVIELPWPDPVLNPNGRAHTMAVAGAKARAKDAAHWATRQAIGLRIFPHDGRSDILLRQVAHPPAFKSNGHRNTAQRDRDNLDAALKAARDGISSALGINDKFFRPTGVEWGEPRRRPCVVITVVASA